MIDYRGRNAIKKIDFLIFFSKKFMFLKDFHEEDYNNNLQTLREEFLNCSLNVYLDIVEYTRQYPIMVGFKGKFNAK